MTGLGSLLPAHEDAVVAVGREDAEERLADLGRPGGDVRLGPGSLDQISSTPLTETAPMPFLASRSGPGQALPRASTILFAVMDWSSESVVSGHVPNPS